MKRVCFKLNEKRERERSNRFLDDEISVARSCGSDGRGGGRQRNESSRSLISAYISKIDTGRCLYEKWTSE